MTDLSLRKILGVAITLLLFMIGMELHSYSINHKQKNLRKLGALLDPKSTLSKVLINDINPSIIACGHHKCFALSKSDPSLGYQMIRNGDIEDYRPKRDLKNRPRLVSFKMLDRLFNFAQCLQEEYDIPHSVGKPHQMDLTEEMVGSMVYPKSIHPSMKNKEFFRPGEILVLPVRYSEKAIPFAIHQTTNTTFLEEHIEKSILANPDYFDNFVSSIQRLNKTISEEVGCLVIDFQGMLDENGTVYLFDIDPCKISKCKDNDDPLNWDNSYNPVLRDQQIIPFQQKVARLVDAAHAAKNQRLKQEYS